NRLQRRRLGETRLLGQSRQVPHGMGVGESALGKNAHRGFIERLGDGCDALRASGAEVQQGSSERKSPARKTLGWSLQTAQYKIKIPKSLRLRNFLYTLTLDKRAGRVLSQYLMSINGVCATL